MDIPGPSVGSKRKISESGGSSKLPRDGDLKARSDGSPDLRRPDSTIGLERLETPDKPGLGDCWIKVVENISDAQTMETLLAVSKEISHLRKFAGHIEFAPSIEHVEHLVQDKDGIDAFKGRQKIKLPPGRACNKFCVTAYHNLLY